MFLSFTVRLCLDVLDLSSLIIVFHNVRCDPKCLVLYNALVFAAESFESLNNLVNSGAQRIH